MSDEFKVVLESNIARVGAKLVRLDPEQTEFLYVLNSRKGKSVSRQELMRGLYGPVSHHYSSSGLDRLAQECGSKIKPFGLCVEAVLLGEEGSISQGYRLAAAS